MFLLFNYYNILRLGHIKLLAHGKADGFIDHAEQHDIQDSDLLNVSMHSYDNFEVFTFLVLLTMRFYEQNSEAYIYIFCKRKDQLIPILSSFLF